MLSEFPEMLTQKEVAALFRRTPRTIWLWTKQGKLTAIRSPGGRALYSATQVRALLEQNGTGHE